MRVGTGSNVFQPSVGLGVDNAHDRAVRHVARRQIISIVSWVIPSFVDTSNVGNTSKNLPGRAVNHVLVGRESLAIVISAPYEKVVCGALDDTRRHAIRNNKAIHDHRPTRNSSTTLIRKPGIDLVDISDVG